MHEQSETIQRADGKWINVYGRGLPNAGIQLPGSSEFDSADAAVAAAKARSQTNDTGSPLFSVPNLQGLLSFAPTEDEKKKAMTYGLIGAGLGILSANAQNPRGAGMSGALGGAMPGLQMYQQTLNQLPRERLQNVGLVASLQKLQKDMQAQDALKKLVSPASAQDALAQGAAQGDIGPTNTNAARVGPAGGQFPGVNPAALQLAVASGNVSEVAKILQQGYTEANKPVVNRGFGIGTMQGGKYVPDQASLDQALSLKRGEQGIELPYRTPVDMPTSSGLTTKIFPSEFPLIQQGGVPARLQPQPGMVIPPEVQRQRDAEAAAIRAREGQPGGGGMIPSSAVLGKVGVSQSQEDQIRQEGQRAESKQYGERIATQAGTVMEDAAKAAVGNRYLDVMVEYSKDFTPGKLAPLQNSLTQWAQALGVPVSESDKKAAGSIQALTSMAIKLAGQATRQSDAQPSQLQYFKILESMPNEQRTIEGFNKIVGYMRDLNNLNIIKAQELQKWRTEKGTAEGFEAQWPGTIQKIPFAWNNAHVDAAIRDARPARGVGRTRRYNPATGRIE